MTTRMRCVAGVFVLLAVTLVGCGGKPYWVQNMAPKSPDPNMLYAVGIAAKGMNERMELQTARNKAKVELAGNIDQYVAALTKDFMQSARDFNDPNLDSSIQFVSTVSKSITAANVRGTQELDKWRDPKDGTLYVLSAVPKSAVRAHLMDVAERKARAQEAAAAKKSQKEADKMKAQTDSALKDLKTFMDRKDKEEQ